MTRTILMGLLAAAMVAGLTAGKAMAAGDADKPAAGRHAGQGPFAKLNLTDDQKARIKEVLQQARKDAQAATDRAEKRKIVEAAREKIRTTVLTEDQRKQLGERFAANHPRLAAMGKLAKELNLTDDQKAKSKEILQQARKDAQAATDKEAKQKIMQDARKKIHDTVLTDDQRKKLEELRKNRPQRKHDKDAVKPGTTT
jgi:periplasmic protein CpxP/Spy